MKIFPAIDLMGGKVVRLFQGDPNVARTYDYLGEPVAIAKKWEKEGADALHIIDLDAAFNMGNNLVTISKIIQAVNLPVHVGGGIRSLKIAESMINMGVRYILLGTLAFRRPDVIVHLRKNFGDCIIVALDYRGGKVMVEGWKTSTELKVDDAMKKFLGHQVKNFLLTSISRDGTLKGVDINILAKACAYKDVCIIAAGGVSSLKDLAILKRLGVYGVTIGKALYEGMFTLEEALKIAKEADV